MSTTTEPIFGMERHAASSTNRPLSAVTELRVSVRSVPHLADHGFQDMVVLPGSFFIDAALSRYRERLKRVPDVVRNASFHYPVVLSAEETVIKVEMRDQGDGCVEFLFSEAGVEDSSAGPRARRYAATLEVEANRSTSPRAGTDAFSIEAFQAQSLAVIDRERFYGKLRANGNRYGPSFQNVSSIWLSGDQSLGRVSVVNRHGETEPHYLRPSLLDSITQLLAPFIMEKGQTFVLRSIEKIEVSSVDFPDTLWGHATLRSEGDGCVGDVRVFDPSGKPYLELSGAAFTLLDRVDADNDKTGANLVIAANFTAEPLEESLKFWGDHFGVPLHVEFAPYNQIFQQLLGAGSAFRKAGEGVNVILLGLEEWTGSDRPAAALTLDKERAEHCFRDRARYVLPNGLEIVHWSRYETDHLYQEIFEDQCYLKHGIRLQDGDTVVDIGANIGLFSLFVMSHSHHSKIYAFEPAPAVYELLKSNCEAYGSNVRASNVGVSDRVGTAMFTFYEKSSVFSSFHPNPTEDRAAIQAVVRNRLTSEASIAGESVEEYVEELTADRLRSRTHECPLTTVSEIIRENRIETIHLLKIDAEKSELPILEGIDEGDWPKISQIVIEIHDRSGAAVKAIERLLVEKGYRCAVEQEKLLEHAGLCNLYAIRETRDENPSPSKDFDAVVERRSPQPERSASRRRVAEREAVGVGPHGTDRSPRRRFGSLERNLQEFCAALRSFMNQATVPLVLCFVPRTPGVKADAALAAALDDAEETLSAEAGRIANVHCIPSASLFELYPVKDYYDPQGHRVGHIPYTAEGYAAIGTAIVRTMFHLQRKPSKVIVLDCDNTLWKGVCGEDGPLGIEVTAPYRGLQEFMIGQMNSGMALCLCSKNNEKDVLDVFDRRTDMVLKREHMVSWRINWKSKSENLRSLASELNLGLDSFIFIDDNPLECAEVRIHCPGVLALQLPRNTESFPSFFRHVWAFDGAGSTDEDRRRTRMYRQNAARQRFREEAFSLKDFVEGLQLRVEISDAREGELSRVAQLTFRTNQFNFTTIRRGEPEIADFLKRDHARCLVVRVADRFGDYGLVGAVMYEIAADRYKVDTFLLSCRVLGRGVEHAVVSRLGQRALEDRKRFIEITCLPTERNLPAREFVTRIGDGYRNEPGTSWTFPAEHLARVEFDPDEGASIAREAPNPESAETLTPRSASGFGNALEESECLQRIGENLYDVERLTKAIEEYRLRGEPPQIAMDAKPGSALETALLNIWRKVLARPQIGRNDNFLEVGGTSVKAVQVIALIKKELNRSLSIVSLFECPTVALLAARLRAASGEVDRGTDTALAARRGRERRRNVVRRNAS